MKAVTGLLLLLVCIHSASLFYLWSLATIFGIFICHFSGDAVGFSVKAVRRTKVFVLLHEHVQLHDEGDFFFFFLIGFDVESHESTSSKHSS